MRAKVAKLAETPFDTSTAFWREVLETRLVAGEATVAAAHGAMLHQGARGYVSTGAAQRRLREAYFVAIVTPATKQLRKMLARYRLRDLVQRTLSAMGERVVILGAGQAGVQVAATCATRALPDRSRSSVTSRIRRISGRRCQRRFSRAPSSPSGCT